MLPFYFPFLTFNKLHSYPLFLWWILPMGHKEFGKLLITVCASVLNILGEANQELKGKMLCLLIWFLLTNHSLSYGSVHLPHRGLNLLWGPGDTGPRGHTMFIYGAPSPCMGILQCISISPTACCWEMLGFATLAQMHVAHMRHVGPMCPPSHCCNCILADMQPGRVELQEWPLPQGTRLPSCPGGEGGQDCLWSFRQQSWHPWC
jgi:hypothetical protein